MSPRLFGSSFAPDREALFQWRRSVLRNEFRSMSRSVDGLTFTGAAPTAQRRTARQDQAPRVRSPRSVANPLSRMNVIYPKIHPDRGGGSFDLALSFARWAIT